MTIPREQSRAGAPRLAKGKHLPIIKLTNMDCQTKHGCRWEKGKWVKPEQKGTLEECAETALHAYRSPYVAVLLNHHHGAYNPMRMWEGEMRGPIGRSTLWTDGFKLYGKNGCRVLREIKPPKFTVQQLQVIACRIFCWYVDRMEKANEAGKVVTAGHILKSLRKAKALALDFVYEGKKIAHKLGTMVQEPFWCMTDSLTIVMRWNTPEMTTNALAELLESILRNDPTGQVSLWQYERHIHSIAKDVVECTHKAKVKGKK